MEYRILTLPAKRIVLFEKALSDEDLEYNEFEEIIHNLIDGSDIRTFIDNDGIPNSYYFKNMDFLFEIKNVYKKGNRIKIGSKIWDSANSNIFDKDWLLEAIFKSILNDKNLTIVF